MKKIYLFLAAISMALVACNKAEVETVSETPETPAIQKANMVYIGANLPEFVGETKATVGTDGIFAWEDGDRVSVLCKKTSNGALYHIDFTYDATEGKFGCDLTTAKAIVFPGPSVVDGPFTLATNEEAVAESVPFAYYPAMNVPSSGVYHDVIGERFKMTGTLENDGIHFVHNSALIKLDYTNVPSIAEKIRVTNSEGVVTAILNAKGNVSTMIPVTPSGSSETITFELLTDTDAVLVSKSKTANIVAGTLYKTPTIPINPDVYLISDLTSWTYGDALLMSGSGSTRTATLVGNVSKYYRYYVDYGTVKVDMGPATNGSVSTDETFENAANASMLSDYGVYDFTFDFTTAKNTVTVNTTTPVQIYLTGSFQASAWNLNNDTPMTMVNSKEGYLAMDVAANSTFKAYTNPYWGSAFPAADVKLNTANYYLLVADAEAGTLLGVYANATSSSAASMTLKGSFDSWGAGSAMTQIGSTPFWYIDVDWDVQTEFKFVKNDSDWMAYGDGSYATSSASQDWSGGNIRIVAGKYRIIASENDGRFAIFDKN